MGLHKVNVSLHSNATKCLIANVARRTGEAVRGARSDAVGQAAEKEEAAQGLAMVFGEKNQPDVG